MAYDQLGPDLGTLVAAADLSAKQYFACKIDSNGAVALCAVAGERSDGILQDDPASGRSATLRTFGASKGFLGGSVAAGDLLTTDANGKLVKGYGADIVAGRALAAGVASDIIPIDLSQKGAFCQHAPHSKTFHLKLAKLADGDIVTAFTPGYAGRIKKVYDVVTDPATTGGKASTLNLEIGATNLTGGVLALTSANQTPLGAVVEATAITGANVFSATDTISLEASATTTFAEGEVEVVIEFA